MGESPIGERAATSGSVPRIALAAAVSMVPFAAALVVGYVAIFAPALAAVMIRPLGAWRAWTWVAIGVTAAGAIWGGYTWLQMNASCTVHGPLAPALLFGLSVLAGATTGAVVTGTAGSTPRAVGGFVVALLMTALVAALTTLIAVALGLPALFYSVSHC